MKRVSIPEKGEAGDEFCGLHGGNVVITLDGNIVNDVLSFDIPGGKIMRLKRTSNGRLDIDWNEGEARTEVLQGKVAVCWAEPERMFG